MYSTAHTQPMPAILEADKRRDGVNPPDGNFIEFELKDLVGGISTPETLAAGKSSIQVNNVEQLTNTGTEIFGSAQVVGDLDETNNFPINKNKTTVVRPPNDGSAESKFHENTFPIIGQAESYSSNYGSGRFGKYAYFLARKGGVHNMGPAQVADPSIIVGHYALTNSTVYRNSPYCQNGTGGRYSHEQYYDSFGLTSLGGDPGNTSVAKSIWPGHLLAGLMGYLTASVTGAQAAGTHDYPVSANIYNSIHSGGAILLFDEKSPGATWADETADPSAGLARPEPRQVISKLGNNTVRLAPFKKHDGAGAPNWTTYSRASTGVRIMPIQLADQAVGGGNRVWIFNHTRLCPKDAAGRDYSQFNAWWCWNNRFRDSNGATRTIVYKLSAHDVTESGPNILYDTDCDGDGNKDNCIINNINYYADGQQYAMEEFEKLFGVGEQSGGTGENFYDICKSAQIETILSTGQWRDDQTIGFADWSPKMYRAVKFIEQDSVEPWYSHILCKSRTSKYPETSTTAVGCDSFLMMWGSSLLAQGSFCHMNSGADPDKWYERFSLDAAGNGLPNTSNTTDQDAIKQGLRYLGKPIGRVTRVSDTDLTPSSPHHIVTYDFANTSDLSGWQLKSTANGETFTHNSALGQAEIKNAVRSQNFTHSANELRSPEITGLNAGDDIVYKIEVNCADRCRTRYQFGNTNSHDHNMWLDSEQCVFLISHKLTTNDLTSGFRRKLRIEFGLAGQQLNIKRIDVFSGPNINPLVYAMNFEKGIVVCNGTDRQTTTTFTDTYMYPNAPANEMRTGATPGQNINSITLDKWQADILYKPSPSNILDDLKAKFDTPAISAFHTGTSIVGTKLRVNTTNPSAFGPIHLHPYEPISPT